MSRRSRRPNGSRASSSAGDKLGYDPRLHTPEAVARYAAACEKAGAELVAVDANPIDAIWPDRPPAPLGADHAAQAAIRRRKRGGEDRARAAGARGRRRAS